MPVYEYKCEECKKQIELFQKISDPPAEKCKSCGGRLKKLISNSSFILKGPGFYVNDYKNKPKPNKKKEKRN